MLDDIFKATRQSLLERIASPLLGSFVLAWCVWNWKFLVILFSSATVNQTFALAELYAFPDAKTIALKGILYPLLSALVYIFAYPFPAQFVYEFTLKRQRELNEAKKRIADETPLTVEESRRLRAEYVEYERKQKAIIAQQNEEISRLNAALEENEKVSMPPPLSKGEQFYDHIETDEIKVLNMLEKGGGQLSMDYILKHADLPKIKVDFAIGELQRRSLISRIWEEGREFIEFTHEGRRVLLKYLKELTLEEE